MKFLHPSLPLICAAIFSLLAACGGSPSERQSAQTPQLLAQTGSLPNSTALNEPPQFDAPGPQFPAKLDEAIRPTPSARPTRQATQSAAFSIDTSNREAVRLFYRTVFASSEGIDSGWVGDIAQCNAGNTSSSYKDATLRRINWFRAMAGVPADVQWDATFNANAQQAAMLMSANNSLSHSPPTSWKCYNSTASQAAGKSNLSLGNAGAAAITSGYLRDPGSNNSAVGHRRWVLLPQTKFMGTGDVPANSAGSAANALWVQDANVFGTRPSVRDEFVAWPAKGFAPYTTVYPRWSFSYPAANFSAAVITMTENGQPIATRKEAIANGYGENTLVWLPGSYTDGTSWARPSADTVYQMTISNVSIAGQSRSFSYSVTVFDPDQESANATPLIISGNSNVNAGVANSYTFAAQPGASDYQWRSMQTTAYSLNDGAELGTANFIATHSASYNIVASDVAASGSKAFHFAHPDGSEQSLQIKANLVASSAAQLRFKSRLGLATATQIARVEVSSDDGKNWQSLFQQAGQQSGSTSNFGESAFTQKTISLAQYAEQTILLRFRYERGGSFYPQTSNGTGWYVDDIELSGVETIASSSEAQTVSSNAFSTSFANNGSVLLQVRPGMYGYYSNWSALKRVTVANQTVFTGSSGEDVFDAQVGGPAGLSFNGGDGVDTVRYNAASNAVQLSASASGYSISGISGVDSISAVERLQFSDKIIALDINGNAGQAYRIYQAAFNRQPDAGGLKYWIGVRDRGASMASIAAGFINSDEFKVLYGSAPNTEQFVSKLYNNVLHRAYDQGGFDYWTGLLNQGRLSRAQVLASFAESAENQAGVLAEIEAGISLPL